MFNNDTSLTESWTILKTLQWTADYFKRRHIEHARASAELLLAHCLHCERIELYLKHDQPLNADELGTFKELILRRVRHEPDAYIIGQKEFWSLPLRVTAAVLIPRPETECLVETALQHYLNDAPIQVLELGTGSGAISVALAHERPYWQISATDICPQALDIARENAHRLLTGGNLEFFEGSWFDIFFNQEKKFDLIISNPPYISSRELSLLDPEIRQYEPMKALDGGSDGLASLKRIIKEAPAYLKPEGLLILEIGCEQAEAVAELGYRTGAYQSIRVEKDYSGLDRVATFQFKKVLRIDKGFVNNF